MKKTTANSLMTVEAAAALIRSGRPMTIAGSEALLKQLPRGRWIGGTIPYFMSKDGGLLTHHQVFVSELPPCALEGVTRSYDLAALPNLPRDGAQGGCTFVILPAFSAVHVAFGRDGMTWPGLFDRPVVGWVSGLDLKDAGQVKPGVIDGFTGEFFNDRAVALHVKLEPGTVARVDIVNIFEPGDGDEITFERDGFEVKDCLVNGQKQNFARYIAEKKLDTKMPLVANYSGALMNVSVQTADAATGTVSLYAPVFPGMGYRFAKPVPDYAHAFQGRLDALRVSPDFSCNCILNYLYGGLEGR